MIESKDYEKQCEVNSGIDDAMTGGVVGKNGICPHDSSSVHSQQKPWISAYLDYKWAEIELCARHIIVTKQL